MPIYEYLCKQCGGHIEKRQSVMDAPLTTCEECGGSLEKQWSLSGFQFKGAGWYVTDYSGKNTSSADGTNGTEKSGSESTPAADPASKPANDTSPATQPVGSAKEK